MNYLRNKHTVSIWRITSQQWFSGFANCPWKKGIVDESDIIADINVYRVYRNTNTVTLLNPSFTILQIYPAELTTDVFYAYVRFRIKSKPKWFLLLSLYLFWSNIPSSAYVYVRFRIKSKPKWFHSLWLYLIGSNTPSSAIDVWECVSNFTQHLIGHEITYPCWVYI